MECPVCGYMLSPFDVSCPRCIHLAKIAAQQPPPPPPAPPAPVAPAPVQMHLIVCNYCGTAYASTAEFCPTCAMNGERDAYGKPGVSNFLTITMMWTLTVVAIGIALSKPTAMPLAFLLDGSALVLAIVLVCSRNSTNRGNGWAKISLEIIGFVIGFLGALPRH